MARFLLTQRKISTIKDTEKPTLFSDGEGLALLANRGARSWLYIYETAGKQKRMGLGSYPSVSLADARARAEDARRLRAAGIDPLAAKSAAKVEAAATAEREGTNTVRELAKTWVRLDLGTRKDGGAGALRAMEKDVFPIVGDLAPEAMTTAHILEVVDAMKARGVTRTTSAVFTEIRQMCRWATVRGRIPKDPTYGLDKSKICTPSPPRARVLADAEILWLADRIESAISRRARLLFLLLLSTGNRIGETLLGAWAEIDFVRSEWLIPACHRKGSDRRPARDHLVMLSDFALSVLASVRADSGDSAEMWPGAGAKTMTKAFTDRQTDPATAKRKNRRLTVDLLPASGHWTPHDLRRTARTLLARLGVNRDIAERCVGHTEASRIVQTYNLHDYGDEKRAAMDRLGVHLDGVLSPAVDESVRVPKSKTRRRAS